VRRLALSVAFFAACASPAKLSEAQHEPPPPAPLPTPALLAFVQKSNPGLPIQEAERVSRLVEQVAKEFSIEVPLFAAIVRQESHFKTGAKACRNLSGRRTCDYGLAQVNSFWVDELELDAHKLRTDDLYNLRIAGKILKDVLDRHPEKLGYSFYNTADQELRLVYSVRIEKYRKQAQLAMN
jgi:soluble lytic murein transglycosylase-like protein